MPQRYVSAWIHQHQNSIEHYRQSPHWAYSQQAQQNSWQAIRTAQLCQAGHRKLSALLQLSRMLLWKISIPGRLWSIASPSGIRDARKIGEGGIIACLLRLWGRCTIGRSRCILLQMSSGIRNQLTSSHLHLGTLGMLGSFKDRCGGAHEQIFRTGSLLQLQEKQDRTWTLFCSICVPSLFISF